MVERPSFSTTKVLYNSLLILSHLVHSDNSSRPVCSGDSEFILNIMTTKLFLKFIDKFEDNFDDNLLPLEVLKDKISNGREIRDLPEIRPDVYRYVLSIKKRLNNPYSSSIRAYLSQEDEIVLVGDDDRSRQESNFALIRGNDIYCWAGNARNDGHLNEFINNCDGYIPNSKYHVENVTYITNSSGLVEYVYEHHTTKRHTDRNEQRGAYTSVIKIKGGLPNDVGGHIVAHSIDGPSEAINILPMDSSFNNCDEWKEMELKFLCEYQNDRDFFVKRHICYHFNSQRPKSISVEALFCNDKKSWHFNNI